jgi:hypothetical protein
MKWQPIETVPKDREFLAVWGDPFEPGKESVDLFRYDEKQGQYVLSSYGGAVYVPSNELLAWLEIPKFDLR